MVDVCIEDIGVRETDAQVKVVQLLEGPQGGGERYLRDERLVLLVKRGTLFIYTDSSSTSRYISGIGE